MPKITPFLWFDKNVAEAANFYLSVFPNSKLISSSKADGTPSGEVEFFNLELNGLEFTLMGAGPEFKFNHAISFLIDCKDQEEVDYYWNKLSADPASEECGWLKDKYGLVWQVVPQKLNELMSGPDANKSSRVLQTMLKMKKIIVEDLQKAYDDDQS